MHLQAHTPSSCVFLPAGLKILHALGTGQISSAVVITIIGSECAGISLPRECAEHCKKIEARQKLALPLSKCCTEKLRGQIVHAAECKLTK